MKGTLFFYIVSVMSALIGVVTLTCALLMWLGAVTIMPIGFLFGVGEMSWYATVPQGLTNLWWHVAPGLVGGVLSLVFLAIGGLLLGGSVLTWKRARTV